MKDKIKLVIFDMDGLMVDTESICIKAWDKVFNNKDKGRKRILF